MNAMRYRTFLSGSWLLLAAACMAPSLSGQQGSEAAPPAGAQSGQQLYREGRFEAAAAAFRIAAQQQPTAAELQYNLALSLWRAGQLDLAEEAVERYAAMPSGGRVDLYRGLLGNLRYAEAVALTKSGVAGAEVVGIEALLRGVLPSFLFEDLPQPPMTPPGPDGSPGEPIRPGDLFTKAEAMADRAVKELIEAASGQGAGPQVARNLERALALRDALAKIPDEEQQDESGQEGDKSEQGDKQDEENKEDQQDESEPQPGDEGEPDEQNEPEEQESEQNESEQNESEQSQQPNDPNESKDPKEGQERPEPQQPDGKPEEADPSESEQGQKPPGQGEEQPPQEGEERPQPQPGEDEQEMETSQSAPEERNDAPGERQAMRLTPEQQQRMLKELERLDKRLQQIRARARSQRPAVRRDW